MKSRIVALVLCGILVMTFAAACNSPDSDTAISESAIKTVSESSGEKRPKETGEDVITLKFSDIYNFYEYGEYEEYDGKKVKIRGYMSSLSPLDGKFIYLMNVPYQICPFCQPNTATVVSTVAIYAPDGRRFDFYDGAVEFTGTISVGDTEDEFGYWYPFKMIDASFTKIDTSQLSENLKIYGSLSRDGIINDIVSVTDQVDFNAFFEMHGGTEDDIAIVSGSEFDDIIKRINAISKTDYVDLISILEDFKAYNDIVNKNIEAQNYSENYTSEMDDEIVVLLNRFYDWLNKFDI